MSLAVPLRLIAWFRPPLRRPATTRHWRRNAAIDPCRLGKHLKRDLGLDDYPCPASPEPWRYR